MFYRHNRLLFFLAFSCALVSSGRARSQEPTLQELKAQLERQEKQIQELKEALLKVQAPPPAALVPEGPPGEEQPLAEQIPAPVMGNDLKKFIGDYLAEKKSEDEAKNATWRIGDKIKLNASWTNNYLILDTPNKDIWMHIGGWIQMDTVGFSQSAGLRNPASNTNNSASAPAFANDPNRATANQRPVVGPFGSGAGIGVGSVDSLGHPAFGNNILDLQDGIFFRRIRPEWEGQAWQFYEWKLIPALENNQFDMAGFDEFWVGVMNVPLIGNIRIGHVKTAQGFEGDMIASSRAMTFLERSSMSEAIFQNQNFVTGVWLGNTFFDQHMTYSLNFAKQDRQVTSGADFGDGEGEFAGRLTFLPIDQDEGRHLLHLGLSARWERAQIAGSTIANSGTGPSDFLVGTNTRGVQLQARQELRDAVPAGDTTDASSGSFLGGDNTRMVNTGFMAAESSTILGTEFFYVLGPLSFEAEYGWSIINGVTGITPNPSEPGTVIRVPSRQYMFNGGYAQVAYFLTGEHRQYDRRLGRLHTTYISPYRGRIGPNDPVWIGRDHESHRLVVGRGAWEVAARVSYLNLNDGSGGERINGGIMGGMSLGLNWHMSNNLRLMFQYQWNQRYDLAPGVNEGCVEGFGMRTQWMF